MLPPPPTLLFDTVHDVPSHCPMSSPCDDHPIAMQRVLVGHETSAIPASVAPGGFGNETIDQCAPSQCSTRATSVPAKIESPTAKQLVTLAHETRMSWLFVAPTGFGLDCTDQAVPFQRPISVVPRWSTALPTPKQRVVLGQSTLRNSLCELEMGGGTIDQLVPLDRSRSASGSKSPTTWNAPTAKARTRGRARHRREAAAGRARRDADVRARDVRPRGAVEPLYPREGARRVAAVLPDRDALGRARTRNALKRGAVTVLRRGRGRGCDHRPAAPVPLLGEGSRSARRVGADRDAVDRARAGHVDERPRRGTGRIRAGDHRPGGTVPALHQGAARVRGGGIGPDRETTRRRAARDRLDLDAGCTSGRGQRRERPAGAVPTVDERTRDPGLRRRGRVVAGREAQGRTRARDSGEPGARVVALGTGTEVSTQVWPFQRSTSGLSGPEPSPPTAKQFAVPEQAESTIAPSENPCGIWIGTRRRTLPSQRSAYSSRAGPLEVRRVGPDRR